MTLLNIPVFVGTAGLNLVAFETIVTGQASIVVGKNLWLADLVDGTTEVICPVVLGNPTEGRQGIPKARIETFIAFRKTYVGRLPVRPTNVLIPGVLPNALRSCEYLWGW